MPWINGIKMACEPCIRGHRSTGCTHGDGERVLLPVRKPGRPLSSCPHPNGKACSCRGGITAAIPRRGQCGFPNSNHMDGQPAPLPNSPPKSSRRNQKTTTRAATRQQSQDMSPMTPVDTAGFQPQALDSMNGMTQLGMNPLTAYGYAQMPTFPGGFQQIQSPVSQGLAYQSPLPHIEHPSTPLANVTNHSTAQSPAASSTTQGTSSCCSRARDTPQHTPATSIDSFPTDLPDRKFSNVSASDLPATPTEYARYPANENILGFMMQSPSTNGNGMSNFATPTHTPGPHQATPPIFPSPNFQQLMFYPPTFGTPQHPLHPAQWAQHMAAYQQVPATMPGDINTGLQTTQTTHVPEVPSGTNTLPPCDCGPKCECLWCTVHPYNETTTSHIHSVVQSQFDGKAGGSSGNASNKTTPGGAQTVSEETTPVSSHTSSPPDTTVAGDAGDNFLFVHYDLDGCNTGEGACACGEGACGCGDDCPCLGCETHRNNQHVSDDD